MPTAIHKLVESCRNGTHPGVIARMRSGWAVMGTKQFLAGYSLLLPDPVVADLNALHREARLQFLDDVGLLGDAVLQVTQAVRINYAIFGNLEPALHAHVVPRFADEPESLRTNNPWAYDWSAAPDFDAQFHGSLLRKIMQQLQSAISATNIAYSNDEQPGAIHHIDLTVSDLERSTNFYDRWLPRMGFVRIAAAPEGPLWKGQCEIGLQAARIDAVNRHHDRYGAGLHHLAFAAPSREAVDALHAELKAADVVVLDPPAQYEHYAPGYYATFFLDPDGVKLEWVYTPAEKR